MYRKHTMEELVEMDKALMADPANRNPPGGLYVYTPKARRKMKAIAEAITYHLADRQAKEPQERLV